MTTLLDTDVLVDCLRGSTAATCITRGATLFTFNLKHFRAISGILVEQPYAR